MAEADKAALQRLRRGWYLGGEAFGKELLQPMEGKLGEGPAGELRQQTSVAKADRIMAEELARLGWNASDPAIRRKSDPAKLALATRLRKETTRSIKEIAQRLPLGKP